MRDGFIFYKSFYDSIRELNSEQQLEIFDAIFKYEFENKEVELSGVSKSIFTLILPQLKANDKRYENGKKGGAPKGNQNAKKQPKNNQKTTKKQPKEKEKEKEKVKVKDKVKDINNNMSSRIEEIINYLNQPGTDKSIRSFKKNTNSTRSKISARLNEGFTVEDFKDVIYFKYNQWVKKPIEFKNGVMSDTYYRPDTLFGTHFENYLQEYKEKTK